MIDRNAPVAVFDSGHGGISVLRELVRRMPNEDFLYFGDSANAPYGTRPAAEVQALSCACAEDLFSRGCKALVVACNTATSAAIDTLRAAYPDRPIVGIEPALKPAVRDHAGQDILVLATEMTLKEAKFRQLLDRCRDQAVIHCLPAPGIVELVEQGQVDGPALDGYLRELLRPCRAWNPAAVVLGCTHFPLVQPAIRRALGGGAAFYDGGPGTAREARRRLERADLCAVRAVPGRVTLTNSRPEMTAVSRRLFQLK